VPAGDPPPHIYEQIAGHYRDQIEDGALAPGDRLPSNRELAEQWGVSTATVTRAMQALQTLGLVRSSQGGGTFVARSSPAGSGSIANFARAVARQDGTQMDTVSTFTFANFVPAEPHVADALGVEVGDEVIKRFRLRRTPAGEPVLMAASWCPGSFGNACPRLLVLEELPGGLATVEASIGRTITSLVERVSAALATEEQAGFYGLRRPAPVIVKDHIWYANDDPIYYGRGWHRPDEWSTYSVPL
jgi:DNA-binding GntR family transcriptional regulator